MDQQRNRKQRSDLLGPRVDSFLYDETGLQILAFLERTIMYSMHIEFFAPDVIFYYKEHLQRVISVGEIDSKLQLFWSHWHSADEKPLEWRKIYQLGLRGLPRLEEVWKEWVRERAIVLKEVTEGTPRRLRSASVLPRSLLNPVKRPSRSPVGDPGSQVRNSRIHSESPTQRKRIRMTMSANGRRTPNSATSEQASNRKLQEFTQNPRIDNTKIKIELVSSNRSSPSEQLRCGIRETRLSQMISELDDLRVEKAQTTLAVNKLKDQNAQLMIELDNLRVEKAEDTRYWERLYQRTLKRRNALKRRNKHMQAEHSIGQDEIGQTNLKLRTENDFLQEKLDSYKNTFQFTKVQFAEHFPAQNLRKVVEHVDLLLLKLNKVLQGQDSFFSTDKLNIVKDTDISVLFERGFGLDDCVDDSSRSMVPTLEIYKPTLRSVVLSLISTALCTWVFEAEVGALFQESNLVYSKLQSLMAAQDEKITNCFEFAAHERCIEDPFFQEVVIPRRARQLTQKILDCTAPLIEAHRGINEDYAIIADEWLEAGLQLTEIFKHALYAKVRLILSTDKYECAVYVPGTPFDSNNMQNRTEEPVRSTKSELDRVVDITIFPGLIRYASKEESFNYNRFLTKEAAPEGVKAELLRKAEVLTTYNNS